MMGRGRCSSPWLWQKPQSWSCSGKWYN
jgi:hypothetical protein